MFNYISQLTNAILENYETIMEAHVAYYKRPCSHKIYVSIFFCYTPLASLTPVNKELRWVSKPVKIANIPRTTCGQYTRS